MLKKIKMSSLKLKKINIFYAFMDFAKYFKGCIFDVMEHKS